MGKVGKRFTSVGLAMAAVLLAGQLSGCSPVEPASSTTAPNPGLSGLPQAGSAPTSASPHPKPAPQSPPDYSRLLIQPGDLGPRNAYSVRSTESNPNGSPGITTLFVNQDDTRAIGVTVVLLPDGNAAAATLKSTVNSLGSVVTGGTPQPVQVGTDGTMVSGISADRTKDLTVLTFTEGRAVVRMDFGSAPGDPTPSQVVTDTAMKQAIAVRSGLPSVGQ